MAHPHFDQAVAHINAEDVRALLMDLVDISSPTGKEAGVAEYLVARMPNGRATCGNSTKCG